MTTPALDKLRIALANDNRNNFKHQPYDGLHHAYLNRLADEVCARLDILNPMLAKMEAIFDQYQTVYSADALPQVRAAKLKPIILKIAGFKTMFAFADGDERAEVWARLALQDYIIISDILLLRLRKWISSEYEMLPDATDYALGYDEEAADEEYLQSL